ncbi:Anaphase-promoting complex subunit 23 [Scheffersomyces spartinae]|uniref:Anaphase-promoting complex subunit 23 n=1 Tax=Scheffersomyces spartinae TaxID=45513 RepID=A0A9P7VE00_9ASCO|nr:Anaphase-promoting complex subunit 23 [Scheffersomyces spartinae]KAG7195927.1 Anaphase-promoting complex subunit 23 [Scheffersomyces spartinae]
MPETEATELRRSLHEACNTLAFLNLHQAAKWCAEALNGLSPLPNGIIAQTSTTKTTKPPTEDEVADEPMVMLARAYFNCREFDRAAYILRGCRSGNGRFLRLYAMLIAVDKRATEETDGTLNVASNVSNNVTVANGGNSNSQSSHNSSSGTEENNDTVNVLNGVLSKILQEADSYHQSPNNEPNAFLHYLCGVVYNRKRKQAFAQTHLCNSVVLFPYNWLCWQELVATLSTYDEAVTLMAKLRHHRSGVANTVMFRFFEVVVWQEFDHQAKELSEKLDLLAVEFPNFTFVKVQQFLIAYHQLDYFRAEALFDQILKADPLRLDDLDTYSNMLYVMEKRAKLAYLAQLAAHIDKFRPETCCVIANYHSIKGEHEKAIMYYKRALVLNKNCQSAWTLMGHEFVELKNSHAAIESYRRAVDSNARDFRAWYGLGQAYEVLDMHLYALYYYQRAATLQPTDKRMWHALGNCYDKIGKWHEAIGAFEKALSIDSADQANGQVPEPHVCFKLATIWDKVGSALETYKYYQLCYAQEEVWGVTDETSKARLWLARNALQEKRHEEAYELTKDLNLSNAHDIEEARSIARDARNRMLK